MSERTLPPQRNLVAGRWATPASTLPGGLCDANTGRVLQERRTSTTDAVAAAVDTAAALHEAGTWGDLAPAQRAGILRRLAARVDERTEEIAVADALTTGVPLSVTRLIAGSLGGTIRAVAELLTDGLLERRLDGPAGPVRLLRRPWGPAALITPWNSPAGVGVGKIANALAMGCPVIVKPSEWAYSSIDLVVEASVTADLPDGVLQLLHGDGTVGAALVADERIAAISFTGGQPTGRAIAAAAGPRFAALQLELGGANPAIVCADANIETTAAALVAGMTKLNGQWCEAPRRVLADRRVLGPLAEKLRMRLGELTVGSSLDPETTFGPLSHRPHRDLIGGAVAAASAAGAETWQPDLPLPDDGWFFPPTLVTGAPLDGTLTEVFGPVLFLNETSTGPEALAAANLGADGLAAYVFSGDVDRALTLGSRMRAGEVKVNGTSLLDMVPESAQSFWGASGIGGHGTRDVFEFFGGTRIVGVDHHPDQVPL